MKAVLQLMRAVRSSWEPLSTVFSEFSQTLETRVRLVLGGYYQNRAYIWLYVFVTFDLYVAVYFRLMFFRY